jgi:hypothetical protein
VIETLPTRQAVSKAWEAYSKLCQAAADAGYTAARDRAHERWSRAFMIWDGK